MGVQFQSWRQRVPRKCLPLKRMPCGLFFVQFQSCSMFNSELHLSLLELCVVPKFWSCMIFLRKSSITFYSEGMLHVNCAVYSCASSPVFFSGRSAWRMVRARQRSQKPSEQVLVCSFLFRYQREF